MKRRQFLFNAAATLMAGVSAKMVVSKPGHNGAASSSSEITLFLCGDVMTGRGIDQVLPTPSDPRLYETYVRDANRYVELAEALNGPIRRPVDFAYVWGDALSVLEQMAPSVRIVNLETSVTTSNDHWPKGINYRMHPQNVACLTAAGIDCCVLANNHVLDWGHEGLIETLATLRVAKLKTAGAGQDLAEAQAPAVMEVAGKGRVVVHAFGTDSSGIPSEWAAGTDTPGVNRLPDLSDRTIDRISRAVQATRQAGDVVVASIHWGGNWGYEIAPEQRRFAHRLIDVAGVNVVHGHSSHHVKGIEIYSDTPIVYGCGDLLTDYEGISGYEQFRDDLGLMYFVSVDINTGKLTRLRMVPTQIRRFRLNRPSSRDVRWLAEVLNREGRGFHNQTIINRDDTLTLQW